MFLAVTCQGISEFCVGKTMNDDAIPYSESDNFYIAVVIKN
jgi:hypothetical protein